MIFFIRNNIRKHFRRHLQKNNPQCFSIGDCPLLILYYALHYFGHFDSEQFHTILYGLGNLLRQTQTEQNHIGVVLVQD